MDTFVRRTKKAQQSKDGSKTHDLGDLIGLFYQWSEIRICLLTTVEGQLCEPVIDIDS